MTASSTLAGDLAMALDPVVLARAAGLDIPLEPPPVTESEY
jgi:hypothetical protein